MNFRKKHHENKSQEKGSYSNGKKTNVTRYPITIDHSIDDKSRIPRRFCFGAHSRRKRRRRRSKTGNRYRSSRGGEPSVFRGTESRKKRMDEWEKEKGAERLERWLPLAVLVWNKGSSKGTRPRCNDFAHARNSILWNPLIARQQLQAHKSHRKREKTVPRLYSACRKL